MKIILHEGNQLQSEIATPILSAVIKTRQEKQTHDMTYLEHDGALYFFEQHSLLTLLRAHTRYSVELCSYAWHDLLTSNTVVIYIPDALEVSLLTMDLLASI